jgi:hypothetical protein
MSVIEFSETGSIGYTKGVDQIIKESTLVDIADTWFPWTSGVTPSEFITTTQTGTFAGKVEVVESSCSPLSPAARASLTVDWRNHFTNISSEYIMRFLPCLRVSFR